MAVVVAFTHPPAGYVQTASSRAPLAISSWCWGSHCGAPISASTRTAIVARGSTVRVELQFVPTGAQVAVGLGVATMALYRHLPSKTERVRRMVDTVFGEQELPDPTPHGWRPRLELVARCWWRTVRRHPWVAGTGYLTRPALVPNGVAHADLANRAVTRLYLDPVEASWTRAALAGYVQGMAAYLQPPDEADAHGGNAHPDVDSRFEFGLALVLDGLAARRAAPPH